MFRNGLLPVSSGFSKKMASNHKLGITLKMWMASSSEKLVDSNPSTWHYSSENWNLHGVYLLGSIS
jgi:hypothetical protein